MIPVFQSLDQGSPRCPESQESLENDVFPPKAISIKRYFIPEEKKFCNEVPVSTINQSSCLMIIHYPPANNRFSRILICSSSTYQTYTEPLCNIKIRRISKHLQGSLMHRSQNQHTCQQDMLCIYSSTLPFLFYCASNIFKKKNIVNKNEIITMANRESKEIRAF